MAIPLKIYQISRETVAPSRKPSHRPRTHQTVHERDEDLMLGGPRTGTSALYEALTTLSFHVYHHVSLLSDPAKLAKDYKLWGEALRLQFKNEGTPYGRQEFDKMFADYDAVGDTPQSLFVDDLITAYPDALVILTKRDADSWYRSMDKTLFRCFGLLQACIPLSFDILTDGDWFNETKGKELYAKHYEHVRKLVPKERLLEFDMPFRWGPPLCEFLGVKDVPEEEYSRTNTATNVEVLYTMVTKQAACNLMKRGAWPAVSAVVLGVAGYLKLSGKV